MIEAIFLLLNWVIKIVFKAAKLFLVTVVKGDWQKKNSKFYKQDQLPKMKYRDTTLCNLTL